MFGNTLNSSQYTFITGDGNGYDTSPHLKNDMIHRNDFVFLGQDQKIPVMEDRESDNGNKTNKMDGSMLEKLIDMRKMDDQHIKMMLGNGR
jgi:hypothetical protein